MSQISKAHAEVDELGFGKCSVPMWSAGSPSGFCDKPAFGKRPPCGTWRNVHTGEQHRTDGKYPGYIPGLACAVHGGPVSRVFKDGDAWCAVMPDFINLQESDAGFGDTPEEARADLRTQGEKT